MIADSILLRDIAYSLVPAAWPGLDDDQRNDVIDTLFYSEYLNALEVLLSSTSPLPQDLVGKAREALHAQPA